MTSDAQKKRKSPPTEVAEEGEQEGVLKTVSPAHSRGRMAKEPLETGDVFHRGHLLELLGGSSVLVEMLAETFVDSAAQHLDRLKEAVDRADVEQVLMWSHRLTGAAACIFAPRVTEVSSAMESAARAGSLSSAATLLDRLECEVAAFTALIKASGK